MIDFVEYHYEKAHELALKELLSIAKKILIAHPDLEFFELGNGHWFFTVKNEKKLVDDYNKYEYLQPIKNYIRQWNDVLKLTGVGIHMAADGIVIDG